MRRILDTLFTLSSFVTMIGAGLFLYGEDLLAIVVGTLGAVSLVLVIVADFVFAEE